MMNGEYKPKNTRAEILLAKDSPDSAPDHLLAAIITTPVLLSVFTFLLFSYWGEGPVILVVPWFTPMFSSFVALTALSVAFLALGRYQVLCDPISFWISLTFAAFGVSLVFYVLAWPGLLPDGGSFIANLSNTAAWMSALATSIPGPLLMSAALLGWPKGEYFHKRRANAVMYTWILFIALLFWLLVVFERNLPILVRDDGVYTPLIEIWNVLIVLMHIIGVVLSVWRYRRTRDRLIGYVLFFQIALIFTPMLVVIGGQRYDLWWYLSRVVLVSGCAIVLYGLFSEYVHLFKRVRHSEARYRQLTEALPQLIWTSTADGQCDYLSPQWVSYTGIPQELQFGLDWLAQVHADDRQQTQQCWMEAVTSGATFNAQYRIRRHDGMFHWFKSLALPIYDSQNHIVEWFGSCTDIEDQKQVEADLRENTQWLERSNRDLQDFAFVASHDLHEPLRKIEAFGDAILEDPHTLTDRQAQYLDRLRGSAARMRSMVNGLLQLSRLEIQAQPFQRVDLNQIAGEVVADLEFQVQQSGGDVEVCSLPVIDADPMQMRQLFQNLIGNAIKFQPPGGKPHIRVCAEQPAPNITNIWFEDNGIGFDKQFADHLFEPFKRLVGMSEYEGSGMGLAICRKIVERHNGKISAQSQPAHGATFIVRLPIHQTKRQTINHEADNG